MLAAIDLDINNQLSPPPDAVKAFKEKSVRRNGTMELAVNNVAMGRRDRKARHLAVRSQSGNEVYL